MDTLISSSLAMAAGHLNAPVGPIVTIEGLAEALRLGTADSPLNSPAASALISTIFLESTPQMILRCAHEAGADIGAVMRLYSESLELGWAPSTAWERDSEFFA